MSEKWYCELSDDDMVISTRVRLARNLAHRPFPSSMTAAQRAETVEEIYEAALQIGGLQLKRIDLKDCEQREILSMVEKHLISIEFARRDDSVLLLSEDERISIMINEEDHVRIQVMGVGNSLNEAYELADHVDTALNERLHFAFDDRLGYLTQCPTNLGTGMRASLMLHLPALHENGSIQQLSGTVSKLGLTIRGAYGEGSTSYGSLYQISNQITLGIGEKAAIENLQGIAEQIMKQEGALREQWDKDPQLEDRVWRSYGILQTARVMSYEEAMRLLSNLRIGVYNHMIDQVSAGTIVRLINECQPGCLMTENGCDLTSEERDCLRAKLIRETIKNGD